MTRVPAIRAIPPGYESNKYLIIKRTFDYTAHMDVDMLKALADERRLRIVELLASGERCICDLAVTLDASDALVSHHVKRLREAGLVRTHRVGAWLHCSLEPLAFARLSSELSRVAGLADEVASRPTFVSCPTRLPASEADASMVARD